MHNEELQKNIFDCIVIGKGLIGSAAAKYLSLNNSNVAVIGPDEPTGDISKSVIFSSHYDSGRVQRIIGKDAVWTRLNQQSAKQYPSLEKESGIQFHWGVGCFYVTPDEDDPHLKQLPELEKEFDISYQLFENGEAINEACSDYVFPSGVTGIFQPAPAGHINPRHLIKAQLTIFKKNGGSVFNEVVNSITYENDKIILTSLQGNVYHTKKILFTPGAFANFFGLLPQKLALRLKSETIILARVSETESQRLENLPSMLYEIKTETFDSIYLIRPVQYPDGNYYLKMGTNLAKDIFFSTLEEIQDWFKNGNSDAHLETQKQALMQVMPDLKAEAFFTKRCIITYTETGRPYVGKADDKAVYVATGGNGYGAMCSDELGRVAAHLVTEEKLPDEYPDDAFKVAFA